METHILRNFRKHAHSSAAAGDSVRHWLARPAASRSANTTPRLDIHSPFVDAHFAMECLDMYDRDGVIWCINHRESNRFLPESLCSELDSAGADVFTAEMLDEICRSLDELEQLSDEEFVLRARCTLDKWLEEHPEVARKDYRSGEFEMGSAPSWIGRDLRNACCIQRGRHCAMAVAILFAAEYKRLRSGIKASMPLDNEHYCEIRF